MIHQVDKLLIIHRLFQVDIRQALERLHHSAPYVRVQMYRIHYLYVVVALSNCPERRADVPETFSKALPPVTGYQHDSFAEIDTAESFLSDRFYCFLDAECEHQGVYYGVACDKYPLFRNLFIKQVPFRMLGWCEMEIGQRANKCAIKLFRKGIVLVPCPQPRLNVAYGNFHIECGKSAQKRRAGITLHDYNIGPAFLKNLPQSQDDF